MSFESEFTIHQYEIPIVKFNEPIYLIPFGDVHRFANNCHSEKWLEFLEWCKKKQRETDRVYFLGMGDYDDLASTSERYALSTAKFHSTTNKSLDDMARKRTMDMVRELSFMKGRLIGLIEGNHHYKFMSGITSTQLMAQELGTKYLGVISYIRLLFHYVKGNRCRDLDIIAFHGRGSGRRAGSSINTVEDLENVGDAEIYLSGHDHKKWAVLKSKLRLGTSGKNTVLHHRKILLARTGSFQMGYEPGDSNYVSSNAMPPSDLGVVKIELTPKLERSQVKGNEYDRTYIDIHASI